MTSGQPIEVAKHLDRHDVPVLGALAAAPTWTVKRERSAGRSRIVRRGNNQVDAEV